MAEMMEQRRIDERALALASQRAALVVQEVQRAYVGRKDVAELLLISLLARGQFASLPAGAARWAEEER